MSKDFIDVPNGATHFSDGVEGVYWPAFWKEGEEGCWCMAMDERFKPEWVFHECVEIPAKARLISSIGKEVQK